MKMLEAHNGCYTGGRTRSCSKEAIGPASSALSQVGARKSTLPVDPGTDSNNNGGKKKRGGGKVGNLIREEGG